MKRFVTIVLAGVLLVIGSATQAGELKDSKQNKQFVYTLTNDPVDNGNAVAAFQQNDDGSLVPLAGSPFATGGMGWKTKYPLPHFGPFDLDQAITMSADKKRLFAVNGGSDSIAVFDVDANGGLHAVAGSPFPSGGKNPVSIGFAGKYLVVVNKNEDPMRDMSKTLPNYTTFAISPKGALSAVPGGKVELKTASRSPTQALVVNNRFIYDGDFGSFYLPAREAMWGTSLADQAPSTVRALELDSNGKLKLLQEIAPPEGAFEGGTDTNKDGVPDPLMFGLQAHPKEPLVYVSMVTGARLGIFEYDNTGKLTYLGATPNTGQLICWVIINKAGTRAYTTNNGSDTVSVYDLTDPRHPIEMQHIDLRGYGAPYQMALSSDEKYLYAIKHRTFDETPVGDGGTLNVIQIDATGKLSESKYSPYNVPSRGDLLGRPLGLATK